MDHRVRMSGRRNPAAPARGTIAIVGAGPHGLAAAAYLRAAGAEIRSFGEPLEFWRRHMPEGMRLRSRRRSSQIADPSRTLTIDRYEQTKRKHVHAPNLLLEEFIDYGLWFQSHAVPELERRKVDRVSREDGGFQLQLHDGEQLEATRVVVAAGLSQFPSRPRLFSELPSSLVSHSCEHSDFTSFRDRRVVVIGAGQSALESAALLGERGASVEILARAANIRWLSDTADERPAAWLPPTDVGGTMNGWIAAMPDVFRRLPRALQPRVSYSCIRPAGSGWLRPRLQRVTISLNRFAVNVQQRRDLVALLLDDGSERLVDHVMLGTGYTIDVKRYPFLAPELASEVEEAGGYPVLGPGLESSVPGLHFLGAPAAFSFGPIMRFVVGSWYAAPAVTQRILGRRQAPIRFSF